MGISEINPLFELEGEKTILAPIPLGFRLDTSTILLACLAEFTISCNLNRAVGDLARGGET